MLSFKEQVEQYDGSVKEFARLFNLALDTFNPNPEWLAKNLSISKSTTERWKSGKSAPLGFGRMSVLNVFVKLMENNKYQKELQLKLNLFQGKKITKIDASTTNQWVFYFDDGTKLTIEAVNVLPSIGLIGLDVVDD